MTADSKSKILIAGYTSVQADIMTAAFVRNSYAGNIAYCANGEEFLVQVTRSISTKQRPKLVIIDVTMPIMNGINAAMCMRSIEKGVSKEKIPILFFTARPLEEQFVRAIKFLTPAKYVPLPPKADGDTFRQRFEQVVELLKKEQW